MCLPGSTLVRWASGCGVHTRESGHRGTRMMRLAHLWSKPIVWFPAISGFLIKSNNLPVFWSWISSFNDRISNYNFFNSCFFWLTLSNSRILFLCIHSVSTHFELSAFFLGTGCILLLANSTIAITLVTCSTYFCWVILGSTSFSGRRVVVGCCTLIFWDTLYIFEGSKVIFV